MLQVAERIERDLELVGITAIEDKLQEGIPDTIRLLIDAGMKARVTARLRPGQFNARSSSWLRLPMAGLQGSAGPSMCAASPERLVMGQRRCSCVCATCRCVPSDRRASRGRAPRCG